jgi:hypothetical protein
MNAHPLPSKASTGSPYVRSGTGRYLRQTLESLTSHRVGVLRLFHRRPLLVISLVGLAIRLMLAPFFGHPYDLRIFMAVSWAVAHGVSPYSQYVLQEIFHSMPHPHLFGSFYGIGYPPSWGLVLGAMYHLASAINPNDIYTLVLSLKLPIIAGDLVTALVIYKILERRVSKPAALKAFCLYQLCPFAIVIGAVWGMFDVVVVLLTLLSAYVLLERPAWSLIALAVAASLKPYPIVLTPLYSIVLYRQKPSPRRAFGYAAGVMGLLGLITLIPMALYNWPLSNLYHALASHMSATNLYYNGEASYTYGAASPFNLYNVFKVLDPAVSPPWTLNYLWIIGMVIVYYQAFRHLADLSFTSIVNWSFLVSLAFFTTRFWVSEQNLMLLFSLFLFVVLLNDNRPRWREVHLLWILFFAFILIHVPATAFNWIADPPALTAGIALYEGSFGPVCWGVMSALTCAWLVLLWRYAMRRMMWL